MRINLSSENGLTDLNPPSKQHCRCTLLCKGLVLLALGLELLIVKMMITADSQLIYKCQVTLVQDFPNMKTKYLPNIKAIL